MASDSIDISPATLMNLEGRVVLITGASTGIGRCCAESMAAAGAKVIAVARTEEKLAELAAQFPGQIEAWANDATDPALYERIEKLPALDVLVNNAGTNKPQPFIDVSEETLDELFDLNVKALFRCTQAATKVMLRAGNGGSVVNMSSQMGHVGSPSRTVYCATKHALEGLTKALALELAPDNIRVNAVAPTFVETPLTKPMFEDEAFRDYVLDRIPLSRIASQQDIANAVIFLASNASAMVTGISLKVDGGWTAQ
jgi:NAD(P)-dependent dehydrogenase (short-subunit alcohol dehydrogenase family)